jgi:hypothetical protein
MSRVGRLVDEVVRAASAVRGERIIHAKGQAHQAQLMLLPGATELDVPLVHGPRERSVVARFSRGAGFPRILPDVLGLAVRIPDADANGGVQDLMLSTGAGGPLTRRLPLLRRDYLSATYTSLIAYDVGGRSLVVAALPAGGGFTLATAAGTEAWTPFAQLDLRERLPDEVSRDLRFEITHDAGGFRIGGAWRTARAGAYEAARSVES